MSSHFRKYSNSFFIKPKKLSIIELSRQFSLLDMLWIISLLHVFYIITYLMHTYICVSYNIIQNIVYHYFFFFLIEAIIPYISYTAIP